MSLLLDDVLFEAERLNIFVDLVKCQWVRDGKYVRDDKKFSKLRRFVAEAVECGYCRRVIVDVPVCADCSKVLLFPFKPGHVWFRDDDGGVVVVVGDRRVVDCRVRSNVWTFRDLGGVLFPLWNCRVEAKGWPVQVLRARGVEEAVFVACKGKFRGLDKTPYKPFKTCF
jgi:hypothetical protein